VDNSGTEAVGKKVFFILPNSVIQKEMISELIRQEFEIYLVPSIADARRAFVKYPDCLAFLNIDEGLSEEDWLGFVKEIQENPNLSNVRLGILSYNADSELAKKYLIDYMVPCGFIKLSLNLAESTKIVAKVLEANEAKGRRKYLRVHCSERTLYNFKNEDGLLEGHIIDISNVGMSCTLNSDKDIPIHSLITNIQLKLKGNLCLVDGIIMGRRHEEGEKRDIYVILFDPKTLQDQREKIRTYMQSVLQTSIANL
jgi:hypothetical protein